LQIGIDNVKKFPNIGGLLAYIVLLLTLSTIPQLVALPTWAQAAPANPNAPTDTPMPVQNDAPNNNNYLWWLLLIPAGGLLWALSNSSRRQSTVEPSISTSSVPSSPVNSIDPVLLDGRAPQSLQLDASKVMGNSDRVGSDVPISPVEPLLLDERATQPASNDRNRVSEIPFASVAPVPMADSTPRLARGTEERTGVSYSRQQPSAVPLGERPSNSLADRQPAAPLRLLEERLVVDLHKRKVGEIVVRKEIETRLVQVPIRREILIVEQVDPEFKQLAVVDLGQLPDDAAIAANGIELAPTVAASFTSPPAAIEFLKSLSERSSDGSHELQMNIVLKDADAQAFYREWLEHHAATNDAIGGGSSRLKDDIRSLD
jgi:Domain of unknown function (DUF2382)